MRQDGQLPVDVAIVGEGRVELGRIHRVLKHADIADASDDMRRRLVVIISSNGINRTVIV